MLKESASLKALYFVRIFWGMASCFVRFSVICLYYRLIKSCAAPRHYFWIMHVTTICNIIIFFFYLFAGIFPCIPIHAYWEWPPMQAKCDDDGVSMEAAGVLNTIAEAVLATLPILALPHFKIDKKQRWSIITILSLGFLVTIVGIFRTYYIWQAIHTYDLTWFSGPQWICAEVELDLAVVCASAAPLRPLISRFARQVKQTTSKLHHLQSRPSTSKEKEKSPTSTSTFNVSQVHHQADLENAHDWASIMRTIDLEGIPDDGLGYTVTITGPPAIDNRRSTRLRAVTMNLLHPKARTPLRRKQSVSVMRQVKEEDNTNQRLDIPVTVEVEIEQAVRGFREKRWNSVGSDCSDTSIVNIDAALDGFEFSDFSQHLVGNEPPTALGPGSGSGRVKPDGQIWTVDCREP
jgi:hypothetical protein